MVVTGIDAGRNGHVMNILMRKQLFRSLAHGDFNNGVVPSFTIFRCRVDGGAVKIHMSCNIESGVASFFGHGEPLRSQKEKDRKYRDVASKKEQVEDLKSWMHKNGLLTDKLSLNEKHKPIHYISASEDLLRHRSLAMGPKKDVLNGMDNHFGVVQTVVNRQLGELCSTFDQKFEFVSGQLAMVLQALTDLHPPSKTMVTSVDRQKKPIEAPSFPLPFPPSAQIDDPTDFLEPMFHSGYRLPQVELLIFTKDNLEGWIFNLKRYLLLNHLSDVHILEAMMIALDGDALTCLRPFRLRTTTEEFLFGTQEALVKDYLIYWESLASRVSSIPNHILEGNFVKGLKDEINSVDSLTAFCFFLSSK
uniref:Uncharacterized protein n=1 Tax=Cannabis sativa TaxID=3483 RepID=A0A803PS52_CANSA